MRFRPRLIPAVIAAATVLLGVKVSDILSGSFARDAAAQPPSSSALAAGAPVDLTADLNRLAQLSPAAQNPAQNAGGQNSGGQNSGGQNAASSSAAAPPAASPAQKAATVPAATPSPDAPAQASPASGFDFASAHPPLKDPSLLSPAEIQVLQELSQRRAALDQRASALDQQQVVLQAAEKRIDAKIAELQKLQKDIQDAVNQQGAQDDARIQSLVKIYETMKPQDAAQILGQLDMPIVLSVLTHMKELKTAPILAAMDPARAEAITTAMAQRHDPPPAASAALSAAAAPPAQTP